MTKSKIWGFSLLLISALTVSSCNESDFFEVNINPPTKEIIQEVTRSTANILYILDTSGSMSDKIDNVRRNSDALNNVLKNFKLDFTMGVVDGNGTPILAGTPPVLTPQVPNWDQLFKDRVQKLGGITNTENPYARILSVLDPDNLKGRHKGFHTPNSYLIVIIVTDTDDQTKDGSGWRAPLMKYQKVADRINQYYSRDRVFFFGLVCTQNQRTCEYEWKNKSPGDRRIEKLASLYDVSYFDLFKPDYTPFFTLISDRVISFLSYYGLDAVPLISTLEVFVDGVKIPSSSKNGWTYDYDRVAIHFHGDAIPRSDEQVTVSYTPTATQE